MTTLLQAFLIGFNWILSQFWMIEGFLYVRGNAHMPYFALYGIYRWVKCVLGIIYHPNVFCGLKRPFKAKSDFGLMWYVDLMAIFDVGMRCSCSRRNQIAYVGLRWLTPRCAYGKCLLSWSVSIEMCLRN